MLTEKGHFYEPLGSSGEWRPKRKKGETKTNESAIAYVGNSATWTLCVVMKARPLIRSLLLTSHVLGYVEGSTRSMICDLLHQEIPLKTMEHFFADILSLYICTHGAIFGSHPRQKMFDPLSRGSDQLRRQVLHGLVVN